VTLVSVLSFDFTCTSDSESLLCTGVGFHFWHLFFLFFKIYFGAKTIIIFLPSILGNCSSLATSDSLSAN
jgi:hypothetical protein